MLDSPFMGAGPKFRERVAMLIADWQSKSKVSVLIVDHDIGLLHNVATRIVEMRDGKLVVVK
jgi:ABC-type branched-subunit amino acid transport system ATPase component